MLAAYSLCCCRWKKRFTQEEDSRVEAQARSAYLEHQLLQSGKEPFPTAQRSKPLDTETHAAEPAADAATFGIIERQVSVAILVVWVLALMFECVPPPRFVFSV